MPRERVHYFRCFRSIMARDLQGAISWEPNYSPHEHNLVKDFYVPVLSNSISVNRCIGYFRSSALVAASVGYEKFCDHPDAKMRLIVGLEFTQEDHDRILFVENPDALEDHVKNIIEAELSKEMPDFEKSRLAGLSWMLNNGKMEIKFGVMLDQETKKPLAWENGKWHHKITTFTDENKNSVSINGSINESAQAWKRNGDSFAVSPSWVGGWTEETVSGNIELFEKIWNSKGINRKLNVGIFTLKDLPEQVKRFVKPVPPKETDEWPESDDDFTFDSNDNGSNDPRWVHQSEAIELFLEDKDPSKSTAPMPAGKQGILCMATGTGKTRTALKIVKKMFESDQIDKVIITTHKTDLLHQWAKEMKDASRGLLNLIDKEYVHYDGAKELGNFIWNSGTRSLLIGRPGFQELLEKFHHKLERTLLIVDECHNFRGEKGMEKLSGLYKHIPFRLGLSATPDNEYNDDATQYLYDEIGPIFYSFDLLDAIKNGILCPFEYHAETYTPTAEEITKVGEIKKKFEGAKKMNPSKAPFIHTTMLMEMAKVFKSSEGKFPVFDKFLLDKSILERCIIFGPKKEYNTKIQDKLNIMQSKTGVRWITYYGETESSELDLYRNGDVEVILTCKAIAEGIDLDVKNIILLSSDGTKLETIQRIGRALRTHGNDSKIARVYDFIRDNSPDSSDTRRQEWLSELSLSGLDFKNQKEGHS